MRVAPAGVARQPSETGKHRFGHRWRLWVHVLRYVRACIFLINVRTLMMAALACFMVYLCQTAKLNLRFRMEFSIISVGTVFPLVFSIQQAFSRREEALRDLSMLKGVLMGLYFCHRDWDVSDGVIVRANLGNDESPHAIRCAQLIQEFLATLRCWLCGRTPYESESEWRLLYGTTDLVRELTHHLSGDFFRGFEEDLARWDSNGDGEEAERRQEEAAQAFAERDPHWELYYKLYDTVSRISVLNEELMVAGMCTKAGEAGFSRLAAYLAKTVEVMERLRCIREHRTPFMLRYVSFILVVITIVLSAPYFSFMCVTSRWENDTSGSCPAGYFSAILYVLVLSTLFHVQVALENPFDGIGVDDVFVNMDREFAVTVRRYVRSRAAAKEAAAAAKQPVAETTAGQASNGFGGGKGFVEALKPGAVGGCSTTHGDTVSGCSTMYGDGGQARDFPGEERSRSGVRTPPLKAGGGCSGGGVGGGGGGDCSNGGSKVHPGSGRAPYKPSGPYLRTSADSSLVWEGELNVPSSMQ